ncbi:MAG: hypothetical protein WDZ76_13985 [Pseudohongiellaceae bacterium]
MTSRCLVFTGLVFAGLLCGMATAADNPGPQSATNGEPDGATAAASPVNQEPDPEQQDPDGADEDAAQEEEQQAQALEQESQDDEEQEPGAFGRFIPSEQISQDLGVSFPVDI